MFLSALFFFTWEVVKPRRGPSDVLTYRICAVRVSEAQDKLSTFPPPVHSKWEILCEETSLSCMVTVQINVLYPHYKNQICFFNTVCGGSLNSLHHLTIHFWLCLFTRRKWAELLTFPIVWYQIRSTDQRYLSFKTCAMQHFSHLKKKLL